MQIRAIKTRIFRERENLLEFIVKHVRKVPNNSILVITSKIVALAEGRIVEYKNEKQKEALIKRESDLALKTKIVWLTIKDGMLLANAGIDESNADGKIILLPKNSYKTAEILRKELKKKYKVKNLGVIITDSRLFPLRAGVVGAALGYDGFKGVKSYVGKKDIFGRKFAYETTDVADSLATVAVLCMGEGKERQPLALITDVTDAQVVFTNKINKKELIINPKKDIYAPIFNKLN